MDDLSTEDEFAVQLGHKFRAALDLHGHSFQYAVIRRLQDVCNRMGSAWLIEVAEFPTTTGVHDTRIDFLMYPAPTPFFVVAECKRANPKLKHWCFVRAPFVRTSSEHDYLTVEHVVASFSHNSTGTDRPHSVSAFGQRWRHRIDRDAFHIGFEVTDPREKGDAEGSAGRRAIEEAAGQVCKGMYGLVTSISQKARSGRDNPVRTLLMPAIFTTAMLWTTDADLGKADLATGKLPSEAIGEMKQRPWLYLQYPTSPGLRHQMETGRAVPTFDNMLELLYLRTIAIISVGGIADFMGNFEARALYNEVEQMV